MQIIFFGEASINDVQFSCPATVRTDVMYRAEKKSWYVVARNFFLLLLNFSAWPCLGAA